MSKDNETGIEPKSSKCNRYFSEAFKREKVKAIERGLLGIGVLCQQYGISRTSVYKWIYRYSAVEKGVKTVVQMESEQHKTQQLQQTIAELERIVGQKQMEIDYLNRAFELSSAEVGYDLKKKYAPPPSNGFATTLTPMR